MPFAKPREVDTPSVAKANLSNFAVLNDSGILESGIPDRFCRNALGMKSSDLGTVILAFAVLVAGGWYVTSHRRASAEAGYYEPRPSYFDTDPAELPEDWTGWDAKIDVFIHHQTNRPACDAIEYGWITWHDHMPMIERNAATGSKRIFIRTDHLDNANDFSRVPPIELPFDRGINVDVSTRLQRNQYLVNWAHKYGFRFAPNTPNEWHDYYRDLKKTPGTVVIVPNAGHTMKECRTSAEEAECQRSPASMRCEDDRYSKSGGFLYPEWATDENTVSVLNYIKNKKHLAAAASTAKVEAEESR